MLDFNFQIAPVLHSFNLTDEERGYFDKCLKGLVVDISSDEDEDDTEEEMPKNVSAETEPVMISKNIAQSTPKGPEENTNGNSSSDEDSEDLMEMEITLQRRETRTSLGAKKPQEPEKVAPVIKRRKLWTDVIVTYLMEWYTNYFSFSYRNHTVDLHLQARPQLLQQNLFPNK